ncbi:DDHD domain-containing protein [Colletotrichum graminicola]|uniref:DDHD domain-containing protein n=1 Tax=Colletotrichum graminicola (strain M1.001 / M2 / FGSC 10212) TaxID=645133 RepID=E3QRH0_COLGM|nr:DDHD domain-containing protein [Colletotrichum graminicola M1.001]EFQ33458.1 DDHD domain-containing protein [Colletotrichum graminicola M1.001]WDK09518.1 DDHD domain-containing protein [Colletotrichum graminicola]
MTSSSQNHTYGPKCRLAPLSQSVPANAYDGIPPVTAQYFYSSVIPIDDPLSPGTIAGASDARTARGQIRPFSLGDNNALEKAWLSFLSDDGIQAHEQLVRGRKPSPAMEKANAAKLALLVRHLAVKHIHKHGGTIQASSSAGEASDMLPDTPISVCCPDLFIDVSTELQNTFCALARKYHHSLGQESVVQDVMMELRRLTSSAESRSQPGSTSSSRPRAESAQSRQMGIIGSFSPRQEAASELQKLGKEAGNIGDTAKSRAMSESRASEQASRPSTPGLGSSLRQHTVDDGISGKPFVRAGIRQRPQDNFVASFPPPEPSNPNDTEGREAQPPNASSESPRKRANTTQAKLVSDESYRKEAIDVVVGVSRLHLVSIPALQMKPIYWSPVNDIAVVLRATWFYRDTMLPIPPAVANQLEAGYRELKPHTETWNDELRCAVEVGPLGEEKVSHRLWPEDMESLGDRDQRIVSDMRISTDPFCAANCFRGEAAAEGAIDPNLKAGTAAQQHRSYATYHVIYKDASKAFLLKPSLKPSAYYGRRPVAKIMKGMTVGIPIVRGFDRQAWERVHDKKANRDAANQPAFPASDSPEAIAQDVCAACQAQKEHGQVTDLVLVVHGIGQKFAERVESFHFTHAINAFRREVNLELANPAVKEFLREDQNGIMVLPINWRHTLSFEDGGPMTEEDKATHVPDGFSLKDIEPGSIPAVRSMISDVMFDIPFYLSHHKGKMIKALVTEANRVYRLWCRNNPGFAERGRIHMVGHSLGSAMAIEILSRQPTRVPRLDLSTGMPQSDFFDFDTTNLFLVGSPAGFFLLLERGMLQPRRGRMKPGADPADTNAPEVTGEAGRYGCIAVDNIYNVLAKEDPIAYLLNGTIDPVYATSLRTAYVPSSANSIFKYVGNAMKSLVPGTTPAPVAPAVPKPSFVRLPSQLELEVHDFTREETAERKAYLLNDNGQIDYYLRFGGGPLEIQYLNMLSAHTCYWTSLDFIRMLCMEVGRKPGRGNTIPAMRAQKAAKRVALG